MVAKRFPYEKLLIKDFFTQLSAIFQFPPFKIPSFMFVIRVITAKCVMLRCKVSRTNLFKIVDLFTTPNFIALWKS